MKVQINDKLLVKVRTTNGLPESEYRWTRVTNILRDTLIVPVYVVEILDGPRAGDTTQTLNYLDHAKAGAFISHEFSGTVNA
jgi:hypothetical protein